MTNDNKTEMINKYLEEARNGSDDAIRMLYNGGYFYYRAVGFINDNSAPLDEDDPVLKNARLMSAADVFNLAGNYASGKGVERNYAACEQLLRIAADKGSGTAQYSLTQLKPYVNKDQKDDDTLIDEMIDGFGKAYSMGCMRAGEKLAGWLMVKRDEKQAIDLYKELGEKGDIVCMWRYFFMSCLTNYLEGKPTDDLVKQLRQYIDSLPDDEPQKVMFYASKYSDGGYGIEENHERAWELFEQLSECPTYSDEIEYINDIATPMSSVGKSMDADFPVPSKPLTGSGTAMYQMAVMILQGKHGDVEKDWDKICQLLDGAIKRHCRKAMILTYYVNKRDQENAVRVAYDHFNEEENQFLFEGYRLRDDVFNIAFMLNYKK